MEKAAAEAANPLGADRRLQGLVGINVTAALFGTVALYGKLEVSPVWIVAVRSAVAAVALFLFGRARFRWTLPPGRLHGHLLFTSAMLALHWWAFFLSVQWSGVAVATLTFAVFPFFTVLIEAALGRRWPHPLQLLAGAAIVAAVSFLVEVGLEGSEEVAGAGIGLLSSLGFSVFGLASKGITRELSPVRASFFQNATVAGALLPFLAFLPGAPGKGSDWLWLLVLGLVSTAFMHQLFFYSLQRLSASTCSAFLSLEPVYAIVYAAFLFGEPLTPRVAVSASLIVGASLLMLRLERQGAPA